ncbi:tRNA (adenosine(37)-N6)-threonylcarbamoyltransferase complex dimerization subunit type 1 TsaB [Porcipelethomonas sp.]|uniref:tRNA (adenosine(37)-N6)-threonylcarbamoyltransferase complex dimerization subunit type 1 TsaB n=1 Tax=Porcipelethomonas sp. TaxID=2981675 RepID=UPI003EF63C70
MTLLGIETSGKTASAALYEDGIMLGQYSVYTSKTHSQVILPIAKKLLSDCDREISQLTGIAVSSGPGSYTGIRIGVAAVKAMAFALDIPCFGISSLEGLAYNLSCDGYICPVMTARKNLVYTSLFRGNKGVLERCRNDEIISVSELDSILSGLNGKVIITGDGAENFISEFSNKNYSLSPVQLRFQSGSGICLAALNHTPQSPDEIEASYLQLVKAEKDLINSGRS